MCFYSNRAKTRFNRFRFRFAFENIRSTNEHFSSSCV